MGGLLAFRVGNYDNTAEREQFRFLCGQLKAHYENLEDFCVFVGNYNIGCELDALFIKKDAIISIEFKNYCGKVVANENGEWTCDGKTIKGGSRKTVLQQARINHSTVKKELKVLGVEKNQIKDVPHLIIFHQPIELENNLSATNKSWLHITDDAHFIEKLDDITCPKTDLNPLAIVNLAELLNLNSYYLTEFSNASYESQAPKENKKEIFEGIKKDVQKLSKDALSEASDTLHQEESRFELSQTEDVIDPKEIESQSVADEVNALHSSADLIPLKEYAHQIINAVFGVNDIEVFALNPIDFGRVYPSFMKHIDHEFVVLLKGRIAPDQEKRLYRFLQKDMVRMSDDILYWQTGERIVSQTEEGTLKDNPNIEESVSIPSDGTLADVDLPNWLDRYLFFDLGAKYSPNHSRFEYNLNLNTGEIKVYLGTYFPRSFVEVKSIFEEFSQNSNYLSLVGERTSVSILDLGCGTGGDLFGLLSFLEKYEHDSRPIVLEIDIDEKTTPLTHIFENDGNHVYSLDSVLNLSPFNTRILFYNVKDLNHSRLSCSDSLTNKLGDYFKFDLCKGDFNLANLPGLNIHVEDKCKDYAAKVLQNNKLNVVKGFIFGYYLGISKSVSSDRAVLLKIQKRI